MGGCQNYGPFLATLKNRCRITIEIQKGNDYYPYREGLYALLGTGGEPRSKVKTLRRPFTQITNLGFIVPLK